MIEYHKIETLYERDEQTHRLIEPFVLKNRVYGLLKSWHWTEKIDGTNIRCIWQFGKVTFGGKTDNAQIHADLVQWLYKYVTAEAFRAAFPTQDEAHAVILYGEGYGAGIQKGGGDYSPEKRLILFDVTVCDQNAHGWWLSDENVRDVGVKMGLDVVPSLGEAPLETMTEYVRHGFKSQLNGGLRDAEGLVGRPVEALFDKKGHRLIVKLKTKDFTPLKQRTESATSDPAIDGTDSTPLPDARLEQIRQRLDGRMTYGGWSASGQKFGEHAHDDIAYLLAELTRLRTRA